MGHLYYWILAAFVFGGLSGALYTWMSPRRLSWRRVLLRSAAAYTTLALAIVYGLYLIF